NNPSQKGSKMFNSMRNLPRSSCWLFILTLLFMLSVGCGDDSSENNNKQPDSDVGIEDTGDNDTDPGDDDTGNNGNNDTGNNDTGDGDTDINNPDPTTSIVTCPTTIPPPTSGRLCDVTPGSGALTMIQGTVLSGTTIFENGS